MSELRYDGTWDEVKERLLDEYPTLTEEDFKAEDDDKLLIHLGQKLGKSREELREIIREI